MKTEQENVGRHDTRTLSMSPFFLLFQADDLVWLSWVGMKKMKNSR